MASDRNNVVQLRPRKIRNSGADAGFLGCPVCHGDEFAVVVRGLPAEPYIAALICAACEPEVEISVSVGRLGHG